MDIAPGPASAILKTEVMVVWVRVLALGLPALLAALPVSGEEWSRARINRLPDSAFAVVEISEDGKKVRHLPHHDEQGDVDLPHLRSALSRLGQVHWLGPESEAAARHHLEEHLRELGLRWPSSELRSPP